MGVQRFGARVAAGPGGRAVIAVPFDPDEAWGAKAEHLVGGTVNGRRVRGRIAPGGRGWALTLTPMWMRDASVAVGDDVIVELAPEGSAAPPDAGPVWRRVPPGEDGTQGRGPTQVNLRVHLPLTR
jgi:Domain of unknown function (DUF1905)